MDVLVTGGTGSIGAWVTRELLERGHRPVVYDLNPTMTYLRDVADDVTVVRGDVREYDQLSEAVAANDVDRIVHLAKLLPRHSERNPVKTLEVNVGGSGNVLRAANEHGIRRVVYSSSKSVFADITGEHGSPTFAPITEEYPKFDRSTDKHIPFYTVTNKMVEYFGIRYAMAEDLEFVILRFGSTWGPGKLEIQEDVFEERARTTGGSLVCELVERAMNGDAITLTEAQTKTDNAVYTKDVAAGVVGAALSEDIQFEGNHREFLIDGGRVLNQTEVANRLVEKFPDFEFELEPRDAGDRPHRGGIQGRFDLSRSTAELGYTPAYGIDEAIDDYVETKRRFD